jgi:hypothetical protein
VRILGIFISKKFFVFKKKNKKKIKINQKFFVVVLFLFFKNSKKKSKQNIFFNQRKQQLLLRLINQPGHLISRIDYRLKAQLQKNRELQFVWRGIDGPDASRQVSNQKLFFSHV